MLPVLVLYATREGQSRRIAEHAAARLRRQGFSVHTLNAAELSPSFRVEGYGGVLLVAPVHLGKHAREMRTFLRARRAELQGLPVRLLSVSLSQAGVEDTHASDAQRGKAARDVEYLVQVLGDDTGFPASKVSPVAGALAYSQYSFFTRWVMRRIAKAAGGSTDTTRDHVYTDFAKLDEILDAFAAQLPLPLQRAVGA